MSLEPEDYSEYSDKDLKDLLFIHEQTLAHYDMMLKNNLKEGDKLYVELSKKYILQDKQELQKEIQQRKDK